MVDTAFALPEDLSLQSFVVACDCKQVVDDIQEGTGGAYLWVIREIPLRMSNFNSCHFNFESRAWNVDAHKLARHSLLLD